MSLAKNVLVHLTGKILSTILAVVTMGVLTRLLSPAGFGDFTLVLTFISIFAVLVDFGLTLTATQMISAPGANEEKILGNLLTLRIVSGALFLSLAPLVGLLFPYTSVVQIGIGIAAISFLLNTTSNVLVGTFQKRLIIWQPTLAELVNRLAVLGLLFLPFANLSLTSVLSIFVLGNVVQLLITFLFARRFVRLRAGYDTATMKEIIAQSWPIGISIFFNLLYLRGDVLFLSFYRDNVEIGLYGAAYKVIDVATTIPATFMGLVLPILVVSFATKNLATFKERMDQSFRFFTILAVGIAFGGVAIGIPLLEFIAGEEFTESGAVLAILAPVAGIIFYGNLFGHAIVAINKQKIMVLGYAFTALVTVIGYLIVIPLHGMWGAAWMTLVSEILITAITFTVVYKETGYLPKPWILIQSTLAGLAMVAVLLNFDAHVMILFVLGSFVYLGSLVILGAIRKNDLRFL